MLLTVNLLTFILNTFFSIVSSSPFEPDTQSGLVWVWANWKNLSYIEHMIVSGYELNGEPLYTCRVGNAVLGDGWSFPGKLSLVSQTCTVRGYNKVVLLTGYFQVLTNPNKRYVVWPLNNINALPPNLVVAAHYKKSVSSYVGRHSPDHFGREVQPGEVYPPKNAFYSENFTVSYNYKNSFVQKTDENALECVHSEVLVVHPADGFQKLTPFMLQQSSGLVWIDTDYRTLHTVHAKIQAGFLHDNTTSFICRVVDHNENEAGALYPGTASEKTGACYVKKENKDFVFLSRYQVLTNPNKVKFTWTSNKTGDVNLKKAVIGGKNKHGDTYFIGRSLKTATAKGQIAGRIFPKESDFHFFDINQEPPLNLFYYQTPLGKSPKRQTEANFETLEV